MVDGYGVAIGIGGYRYCIDYEIIPIPYTSTMRVLYYDRPTNSVPKPRPFHEVTVDNSVSVTKLRFDWQDMYSR